MIGFAIGIACLWGLFRVVRGGRHRHGWGRHGGRRRVMRRLFEELDTTPGQERVIRAAADDLRKAAAGMRDGLFDAKGDVARAFRSESFDETVMADIIGQYDQRLDELRGSFVGSMAKVHAALDADQRERLARWMGKARRWGGPYRSHGWTDEVSS
jgi:Spy/CpxP family protein refolding chaperone